MLVPFCKCSGSFPIFCFFVGRHPYNSFLAVKTWIFFHIVFNWLRASLIDIVSIIQWTLQLFFGLPFCGLVQIPTRRQATLTLPAISACSIHYLQTFCVCFSLIREILLKFQLISTLWRLSWIGVCYTIETSLRKHRSILQHHSDRIGKDQSTNFTLQSEILPNGRCRSDPKGSMQSACSLTLQVLRFMYPALSILSLVGHVTDYHSLLCAFYSLDAIRAIWSYFFVLLDMWSQSR